MRVLEYQGLDTSRFATPYARVCQALERDDFRAADVKKLVNLRHGKFYRAKLDDANRLLFALVRHSQQTCAVMLEVIEQHAYDRSRFLRGMSVDDGHIVDITAPPGPDDAEPVRYLHPQRREILYLDKPLSLDDLQLAIYRSAPPLIVVGGAGSGKTALTLEKLKQIDGDVLYVTHSAWLARNARELYYAHGFERDDQDASFLSYRELLESLRVPAGTESTWRDFAKWFDRQRQSFRGIDAHQAHEEMRGVIAASASGVLSREDYSALGVRQSIYPQSERGRIYDLFERYRAWLATANLFDPSLLAHEWLPLAAPRYDFVVVDEVQDLTPAQLLLVLRLLKDRRRFLLCGDSNQIVHPNFFAWSRVKSLLWSDEQLASRQELRVLRGNFRNGQTITQVANTLLKVKHRRFGSIDRESNFLVTAVGGEPGAVALLADKDAVTRALDEQSRRSAGVAVIVLREEEKAEARARFRTPLVFAVHEAKGLEYDSVVLYRFISAHRADFAEVAAGVASVDLAVEELDYHRAHDKTDKSLEIYKFYVNALYVALTRAIRSVYLVESDVDHALLQLLGLRVSADDVRMQTRVSTHEEWQQEARRLELQGKQEQADAVRTAILREQPVPWPVLDEPRLRESLVKVFREATAGGKVRQQLYEFAAFQNQPVLAHWLAEDAGFHTARGFKTQRAVLARKHLGDFASRSFKGVLQNCERYGVEHRTLMNQTPLMAAAAVGNLPLVEALLARGANPEAVDSFGWNALHWAMRAAFDDPAFARGSFAALYERVAPSSLDLQVRERLVRLDRHQSEYLLFQTLWVLFRTAFTSDAFDGPAGINTATVLDAWAHLPGNVLRSERRRRAHLSSVLSRNEMDRDYAYNRQLFKRIGHGWYQLNPALAIRQRAGAAAESWQSVLEALNLPLVHEFSHPHQWRISQALRVSSGVSELPVPIAAERWAAREREAFKTKEAAALEELLAMRRIRAQSDARAVAATLSSPSRPQPSTPTPTSVPRWGTPEAKRAARAELLQRIEEQRRKSAGESQPN